MKSPKTLIILIQMIFLAEGIQAQIQHIKFNKIKGTKDISIGKINGMTQDKYGFMWFSDQTNRCITRFDGSNFIQYQYSPTNPEGLGGEYPECLQADSSGNIWIGFRGQGLDRFDPRTNTFTHFRHDPNDLQSLSNDVVSAILVDHNDNLWIGTNGGLNLLNKEIGKFLRYNHDPNDNSSLSHDIIRSLYEDSNGTIWVGTGFSFTPDNEGGLNKFERSTGTFLRYMHDPDDIETLMDNKIRSIEEDSRGNFWIGTRENGFHKMNKETGKFERYFKNPSYPVGLTWPANTSSFSLITFIEEDIDGFLWIGTYDDGISRFNPVSNEITFYGIQSAETESFQDNSGWWAHSSKDGNVWIATQEANLYRIDLYHNSFPLYSSYGAVTDFCLDSDSVLWIGTETGLTLRNLQTDCVSQIVNIPAITNSLSNNLIQKIIKDSQGIFWIGTLTGLNRFDQSSGSFVRYLNDPLDSLSLSHNDVMAIFEDSERNLWIGTWGGGLNRFDRVNDKFIRYGLGGLTDTKRLTSLHVSHIIEDNNQNIWIGTGANGGLNMLNRKTGVFIRYLKNQSVRAIHRDGENTIWVGTQYGLWKYNSLSDEFLNLIDNTTVMAIVSDKENNIFFSSTSGIYKLNPSGQLTLYGKSNGVNANDFSNASEGHASIILPDGKVLLATSGGYYGFYPHNLVSLPEPPKIYLTDLWLQGNQIYPNDNGPLTENIYNASEINLNYRQNSFALSFALVDFRNSGENTIEYILNNYDDNWRQAESSDRVTYYKVPTGKYNFTIKSINNEGFLSDRSILINIAPPWWMTWWAYSLYGIIFFVGIFTVDRVQRKRLIEKERAKAREKELDQAREIKKAYDKLEVAHADLKATQSQLIQSEKMASLGELTAGIAHEIQNPLNFVNNFSDINQELAKELLEEIEKDNGLEVKAIIQDIISNEEKILHHGKRAGAIVMGMLQHSRAGGGEKEPTDINALADEYLRLAYHGMRAKDKSFNADFNLDLDESLPTINVVPQDIGRVLLNLINNAFYSVSSKLKAESVDYKPEVIVSTAKVDNSIKITVKDNGEGIPEEVRDKIFQPFFTTKPTGQGTGLGLSLSYDIITKGHGGTIELETKEGKGTEFIVSIPVV